MITSSKQLQEIQFLEKNFIKRITTDEERRTYISSTVHGKRGLRIDHRDVGNVLEEAKRKLDISIAMWREDLVKGILSVDELKSDLDCEYGNKIVDSIISSVTKEFRLKTLIGSDATVCAFTNFPETSPNYFKR
jgi:hypothetical protein